MKSYVVEFMYNVIPTIKIVVDAQDPKEAEELALEQLEEAFDNEWVDQMSTFDANDWDIESVAVEKMNPYK
jgi:hypothetical protein